MNRDKGKYTKSEWRELTEKALKEWLAAGNEIERLPDSDDDEGMAIYRRARRKKDAA